MALIADVNMLTSITGLTVGVSLNGSANRLIIIMFLKSRNCFYFVELFRCTFGNKYCKKYFLNFISKKIDEAVSIFKEYIARRKMR